MRIVEYQDVLDGKYLDDDFTLSDDVQQLTSRLCPSEKIVTRKAESEDKGCTFIRNIPGYDKPVLLWREDVEIDGKRYGYEHGVLMVLESDSQLGLYELTEK